MTRAPHPCYSNEGKDLRRESITLFILGVDRPGFTHDVLNAVSQDNLARFQAVQLESNGFRSEGSIRLQVADRNLAALLISRLKSVPGLVNAFVIN